MKWRKYLQRFVLTTTLFSIFGLLLFHLSSSSQQTIQTQGQNKNATGGEITILNAHSHPQAGDDWTISFKTKDLADLTITPDDQATIDDLDFVSLKCDGEERIPQILEGGTIFYQNWLCEGEGKVTHLIKVASRHVLKFQFGNQIKYAYNNPAPSTVGVTTGETALYYAFQRLSFYANGRFWVFYSDGTNLVYRTSTDAVSWSDAATIRTCTEGHMFSVWFDGTYMHYAYTYSYGGGNTPVYYRRGTPDADGTISWSAAEQTAVSAVSNVAYWYPHVSTDSNGYPFIGYVRQPDDTLSQYRPWVTKSSTNDGTWTTASDFPYQLSTSLFDWTSSVTPLTNGKMYFIYTRDNNAFGRLWDGTSFGDEETIVSAEQRSMFYYSVVAEGDDVHYVYLKITSYDIIHRERDYTGGWQAPTTVQSSTTSTTTPALSIDSDNNLYCFWSDSSNYRVYYKRRVSGTWDATPTTWIEGQGTQSLETGGDLDEQINASNWKSQSFISLKDDTIRQVQVYVGWYYAATRVLNASIYNADAEGKPTGSALGSTTMAGTDEDKACAWRALTFSTPISVVANQKYCIVLSCPTCGSPYYYRWQVDSTSPPYTDGNWAYSSDGSSWTADTSKDALFKALFDSTSPASRGLSSYYKDYSSKIGLAYLTGTVEPFAIRHDYLTLTTNATPTNDSLSFTNPYGGDGNDAVADDTTEWNFQAVVSDTDGYANLGTVVLRLANSSDNTTPYDALKFTWTESTDAFSETADTQNAATITSTGTDSTCATNTCTLDFKIKFNSNFSTQSTNYNAELYTTDDAAATDEDSYANFYQVVPISISLSSPSDVSLGTITGTGTSSTGEATWTVTTNNPPGYKLEWQASVATMTNEYSDTIAAYTPAVADTPETWSVASSDSEWGGRLKSTSTDYDSATWGTDDTTNAKWLNVKSLALFQIASRASTTTGSDEIVQFKAEVGSSKFQPTGNYTVNVTVTATTL